MKEFLLYLLQSGICLSFFALVYLLFLRKQTFYLFNRIFLLGGLLIAFILPFIQFSYDVVLPQIPLGINYLEPNGLVDNSTEYFSIWLILSVVYVVGVVIILLRNIFLLLMLMKYRKCGKVSAVDNYKIIEYQAIKTPFSVLNRIYMNSASIQNKEKDVILKHEISHIYQKHWIDLLCSECALLLQWFNPLMWYYIHLQKENHEYLADEAVLQNGESIAVYRAVLINQRFQGPIFSFSNSFNYSNQKNRLNMMKKEKTSPWKKIAALAVLPLCGVFMVLSAKPNYVMAKTTDEGIVINNDTIKKKVLLNLNFNDSSAVASSKVIVVGGGKKEDIVKVFNSSESDVTVVGTGESSAIPDNILVFIDEKETNVKELGKLDPNEISDVSVLKSQASIDLYGDRGKNGVILVKTKSSTSSSAPSIAFTDNSPKSISINMNNGSKVKTVIFNTNDKSSDLIGEPIIYIDGKESTPQELKNLKESDIDTIESSFQQNDSEQKAVIKITTKK